MRHQPRRMLYATPFEEAHKYPMATSRSLVKAIGDLDGQCPRTPLALDTLLLLGRKKRPAQVYEGNPRTETCIQQPHQRHSKLARTMSTSSTQSTKSTLSGGGNSTASLDDLFGEKPVNGVARRVEVGAVRAQATYVYVAPQKNGNAAKDEGVSM